MTPRSDYPQNRKPHASRILHTVGEGMKVEDAISEFCKLNPHAVVGQWGYVVTLGTQHYFKKMTDIQDFDQICAGEYSCLFHHGEPMSEEVSRIVSTRLRSTGIYGHLTAAQAEHIKEHIRLHLERVIETYTYRADDPY